VAGDGAWVQLNETIVLLQEPLRQQPKNVLKEVMIFPWLASEFPDHVTKNRSEQDTRSII
jgi:hypothetical protein